VMCHNPSENDAARRAVTTDAVQKAMPPQAINFSLMIHKIHTGEKMKEDNRTYTVIGFGGSVNDFTEVRFPAMSRTGAVGERRNCSMCHVNGSEQLPLQDNLNMVRDPQGLINPVGPIAAACTGCHQSEAAASHTVAQTTGLGESCEVCHGQTAEFSVNKVHAQ
jgi:OmcA/MtrC family decaheme c-type cytochrome